MASTIPNFSVMQMQSFLPKANIKLEAGKKLGITYNFLQGFKILVAAVKPWKVMLLQLPMLTAATTPIMLITNMVQ